MTVLDVGQGTGALVEFPNRAVYLVDAGGTVDGAFDLGRFVVAPVLWRRGITQVTTLGMTHFHPDHFGGLAYVAEHFGAKRLLGNGSRAASSDLAWWEIGPRLLASGLRRQVVSAGMDWREGEVAIRILHPSADEVEAFAGENDRSVVWELSYGSRRVLLTGDIERAAEQSLVARGVLRPVDVVVVPHHGSNTSSTPAFVDAIRPRVAIISCGQFNRYGFPRRSVLETFAIAGATVYRTDRDGAVTVTTDGESLEVTPYVR